MQFITVLAGASFRPAEAKAALKAVDGTETLRLEAEPTNPYDVNAVKVIMTAAGVDHVIGYVPRTDNYELSLLLQGIQNPDADSPLFAEGHTPEVTRCEILDFVSGPLKPTIVIEVSTGFELGTLVRSDTDGDGDEDFLPEGDE